MIYTESDIRSIHLNNNFNTFTITAGALKDETIHKYRVY